MVLSFSTENNEYGPFFNAAFLSKKPSSFVEQTVVVVTACSQNLMKILFVIIQLQVSRKTYTMLHHLDIVQVQQMLDLVMILIGGAPWGDAFVCSRWHVGNISLIIYVPCGLLGKCDTWVEKTI